MLRRPYIVWTQRPLHAPELVKLRTWLEVKNFVSLSEGQYVIAYNLVSEVETHFNESGAVVKVN